MARSMSLVGRDVHASQTHAAILDVSRRTPGCATGGTGLVSAACRVEGRNCASRRNDVRGCTPQPRYQSATLSAVLRAHGWHAGAAAALRPADRRGARDARKKPVLVWLQFQDCTGNSESMLRATIPTSPTSCSTCSRGSTTRSIMAGAGEQAEAVARARRERGEGQVPRGGRGRDSARRRRRRLLHHRRPHGARHRAPGLPRTPPATIAVGACACDGGFVAARIRPARSACRRRCPASRSSTWAAARTTRPTPPPCWSTT